MFAVLLAKIWRDLGEKLIVECLVIDKGLEPCVERILIFALLIWCDRSHIVVSKSHTLCFDDLSSFLLPQIDSKFFSFLYWITRIHYSTFKVRQDQFIDKSAIYKMTIYCENLHFIYDFSSLTLEVVFPLVIHSFADSYICLCPDCIL